MTERIEKINMDWFLMEPALFKVLCSHQAVANTDMRCPLRSGSRRIEYNPALCKNVSDDALRELFKTECIRILLKHPYTRQPEGCCAEAITRGSNCVVSDNYKMKYIELDAPRDFGLEKGMHFEYYAKALQEMMQSNDNDSLRYDNENGMGLSGMEEHTLALVEEVVRVNYLAEETPSHPGPIKVWSDHKPNIIEQLAMGFLRRRENRRMIRDGILAEKM